MSPASSGPLEVERYIGACLISSQQSRHKKGNHHYQQHHNPQHQLTHRSEGFYSGAAYHRLQRCPSGAGGGVPLLFNPHYANESLTRLAVQTQGIPLILSNKYHNRRNKQRSGQFNQNGGSVNVFVKDKRDKQEVQCTDTVSIASDESCVSNASDTCLPRIIKPRKRRKKDRKPQHALRPLDSAYSSAQDTCSSGGSATSSPDIDYNARFVLSPPHPYYMNYPSGGFHYEDFPRQPQQQPQQQQQQKQHQEPQVVHHEDKNETPKLNHLFEDVVEALDEKDLNDNETSCQCRYCNPSGQIWDMDRGCFSPYLTSPLSLNTSGDFDRAPGKNHLRRHSSDAQSLLESMSTMSLEDAASSSSSLSSSSVPAMMMISAPNSPNLEVSTEIVTSHNGHRDLEIKFFSSFSSSHNSNSSSFNAGRTETGSLSDDVRDSGGVPFDWTILATGVRSSGEQCSSSNV